MAKPSYPKTILEFAAEFDNDEICLEYLIQNRWPKGFICPHCKSNGGWWLKKYQRFECGSCHHQTSPFANTLMHRSHLSLRLWFWAAYLVATHTPGISAVQLQRQLGISENRTVWFLLHRLRQGMVRVDRDKLSGIVEADETHIGGPAKGKKGRGVKSSPNKTLIVGAVEIHTYTTKKGRQKHRAGRLRLQVLRSASEVEIKQFLNTNVAIGSIVKSDGWRGYSTEALYGYEHICQIQGKPEDAKELAPHIHKIFGNLKAWLTGTHHGVAPKYLQVYLNEYVFRFNRRGHPMSAFRSLLGIVAAKEPMSLTRLIEP